MRSGRGAGLQLIERRLAAGDRGDPVAAVVQQQLERLAKIGVVVDDENVRRSCVPR